MRCAVSIVSGFLMACAVPFSWAQEPAPGGKTVQVYPPVEPQRVNPGAEMLVPETRRVDGFVQDVEGAVERARQVPSNVGQTIRDTAEQAGQAVGNARDRLRNQIFGESPQSPSAGAQGSGGNQSGEAYQVTVPRGYEPRPTGSAEAFLDRVDARDRRSLSQPEERVAQPRPANLQPAENPDYRPPAPQQPDPVITVRPESQAVMLNVERDKLSRMQAAYDVDKRRCDAMPTEEQRQSCARISNLEGRSAAIEAQKGEITRLEDYFRQNPAAPTVISPAASADPLQRLLDNPAHGASNAMDRLIETQDRQEREAQAAEQRRRAEVQRQAAAAAAQQQAAIAAQRRAALAAQQRAETEAEQQAAGAAAAQMMMGIMGGMGASSGRSATPSRRTQPATSPSPPRTVSVPTHSPGSSGSSRRETGSGFQTR